MTVVNLSLPSEMITQMERGGRAKPEASSSRLGFDAIA